MDKKKSVTHHTEVHFHAPVGQYIDYIENQTVSFDKDMNMHIAHVQNSNTPQPAASVKTDYCEYICREKLAEQGIYSLDEFEKMMADAAKEPASEFADFLRRYEKQGILYFKKHSKKQIFENLQNHFPQMRNYDYPNFAAEF